MSTSLTLQFIACSRWGEFLPALAASGLHLTPSTLVALGVLGAVLVTVCLIFVIAQMTHRRRELLLRHQKLEQALTLADEVADESMQAALATTLLDLGHFLHEIRNCQTTVAANVAYLERVLPLDGEALDAVLEIRDAQITEQKLITGLLEQLRQRAKPEIAPFSVRDVLTQAIREFDPQHCIEISGEDCGCQLVGNPEHLQSIVHNLVRNALQAGAKHVHVDVSVQPAGTCVTLCVHDDGPGIDPSRHATLFEPFSNSSRLDGTGLGLYLCRRYVGLFGGTVAVGQGPLGGAAFTINLPNRTAIRDSVVHELAPRSGQRTKRQAWLGKPVGQASVGRSERG